MNIIWLILISVSIVFAVINGKLEDLTKALFDGTKAAVEVSLFLLGIIALWLGITKILEDAKLIDRLAHVFRPFISRLFPGIPKDHPAITPITLNLLANFFGLGNAATPLGIKAMQELQSLNKDKDTTSFEMMLFIVINTASIQLIPFTVIGILAQFGSANPSAVVLPTILVTTVSAVFAVLTLFLFKRFIK